MLSLWYSQNTDANGENQLTWTNVARVMVTIGNKSIANHIVQHYSQYRFPNLNYKLILLN